MFKRYSLLPSRAASSSALASLLWVAVPTAYATEVSRLAGHAIEVKKLDFDAALMVDGRMLHKNSIISFDEIVSIDGMLVLVGSSSPGGSACDSSPFILSFPVGGTPRLDGPVDSCASITHQVKADRILFCDIPGSRPKD